MVCTFFGHKDAPDSVKEKLKNEILRLTSEKNVEFYVGNNGNFDYYVQNVLYEISKIQPNIKFSVVISYLNERIISDIKNSTVFPEGLEKVPPRYAISKRNDWLIKRANIAIVFVKNRFTNSYRWMDKAQRKGIKVINLAEDT